MCDEREGRKMWMRKGMSGGEEERKRGRGERGEEKNVG